jgi:hypothetical protein
VNWPIVADKVQCSVLEYRCAVINITFGNWTYIDIASFNEHIHKIIS